jgi:uncharacterized protein (TIGR02996 family)
MADHGDVLMREILDHPDDDAPRVVYADWLLLHGDEEAHARAELIHAQCALETATAAEKPALQVRARTVLKEWKRTWTKDLTRAYISGRWRFRRGFLDGGTLTATKFVEVAEVMFQHAPMLRSMIFPEASNELVALSKSPYLARLDDVDLDEMCRCGRCKIERELPDLFASPNAVSIRRLILSGNHIDPDNARKLGESPHLRGLVELDVSDNRIDAAGAVAIVQLGNLRKLSLSANPIGDDGARALAKADLQVADLDLSYTSIGEIGARALADASWADSIRSINLRGNKLGKGAPRAALRARFGARLKA